MKTESLSTLQSNLAALAPLTRRVLEAASPDGVVQIHTAGGVMSASLRVPDGRVVRIHSGRDPVAEADRFVEGALGGIPSGVPSVVIVIGPGLGYVIEAIQRRAPGTRVIAVEPFPALARAMMERRDWTELLASKHLALITGPEYLGAGDAGRLLDERAAASTSIIEHPVAAREFPSEMARAHAAAERVLQGAKLNAEARRLFAGRYLLNTLANLPAVAAEGDVSSLFGRFAGVPAVVVAAGPSLDAQIEHLKTLVDQAVIIAVDTTLRPLQAAGIQPHLVVAIDPSEFNANHLLGVEDTEGSWLVSEGSIDPRVFPEFAGHTFTFTVGDHHPWPWMRGLGVARGTLRAWGSVLTTAFDLACVAGCEPIVFIGADLAHTEGLHYCRGTRNEHATSYEDPAPTRVARFADALRHSKRPTCEEIDIHGVPVTSTPPFVQFRDWLVQRASEAVPRPVMNATGAGILHGEAIRQVDFSTLSWPPQSGGDDSIRAQLSSAWRASAEQRAVTLETLARMFEQPGTTLPQREWVAFSGDALSIDQIEECLERTWRTPPLIVAEPHDQFFVPGWEARFAVAATGGPRPAVSWECSTDDGRSWVPIEDATDDVYTFTVEDAHRNRQFRAVLTNRHGAVTSRSAILSSPLAGVVGDFSGDGRPDILWRHLLTGANTIWFMDGVTRRGIGVLIQVLLDQEADLAGTGDFNGDGHTDLLWRHSANGRVGMWLMEGVAGAKRYGELDAHLGLDWTLAATADFDSDGKSELVWRHAGTGENLVWFVDGMTKTGEAPLDSEPETTWAIVGAADFNGDGKPDLLWRNGATGENRVWFMNGLTRTGEATLDVEADLAWTVVGTGDFSGDGQPDIVWRHAGTGDTIVWYMNGVRRIGQASLAAAADCSWLVSPDAIP